LALDDHDRSDWWVVTDSQRGENFELTNEAWAIGLHPCVD